MLLSRQKLLTPNSTIYRTISTRKTTAYASSAKSIDRNTFIRNRLSGLGAFSKTSGITKLDETKDDTTSNRSRRKYAGYAVILWVVDLWKYVYIAESTGNVPCSQCQLTYTNELYSIVDMIKTIQASALRSGFKSALGHVKKTKKPLVITERGVPTSVLVSIDEYEDYLSEHDPELIASIKRARKEYTKKNIFSFSDVFGDIA
jgi:prevent-host-death family protein